MSYLSQELEDICRTIDECVAYTKDGKLLVTIKEESQWSSKSDYRSYIADMDVCKAGIHECFGNSTCVTLGTLPRCS